MQENSWNFWNTNGTWLDSMDNDAFARVCGYVWRTHHLKYIWTWFKPLNPYELLIWFMHCYYFTYFVSFYVFSCSHHGHMLYSYFTLTSCSVFHAPIGSCIVIHALQLVFYISVFFHMFLYWWRNKFRKCFVGTCFWQYVCRFLA